MTSDQAKPVMSAEESERRVITSVSYNEIKQVFLTRDLALKILATIRNACDVAADAGGGIDPAALRQFIDDQDVVLPPFKFVKFVPVQ